MESDPWKKRRRRSKHKRQRKPSSLSGGQKSRAEASGNSSRPSKRREVKPTSSFAPIAPSNAPVSVEVKKPQPPAVWRAYLLGLGGVTLLVLLGGGHNVFALSLSLLLPGLALVYHPPRQSPGKWMDRMALAFVAVLLLAFIPQFYWPDPDWRTAAEEIFAIDLPSSLSIQPWISFEAWLCALAGLGWLYAAISWEINHTGRKWFYFAVSVVVATLSLVVLWGNMNGVKYFAAEKSTVFSFFPNRNQTANFLAVGGVASFGYALCALRTRRLLPLVGLIASGLAFFALVWGISRAGVLLFFGGMVLAYLLQSASGRVPKALKFVFPVLIIAFSIFLVSNSRTTERIVEFVASSDDWSDDYRLLMARDAWAMIEGAPLTGHGLGNFSVIFPQYRDLSANYQRAVHPESDLLWLASEGGLLGTAFLLGFILAYLLRCRGLGSGQSGGYRLAAFTALVIFLFHGLVDVSGHRPGTMYFAILFAALALPSRKVEGPAYNPLAWRIFGWLLIAGGLLWGLSGLTGLPLHSSVATSHYESSIKEDVAAEDYGAALVEVDKWIGLRPFDWRAYFQRATLTLSESGARGRAAADFRRARFVEPTLGLVALEEGLAWIPYDSGRAVAAWREVFFRELESREGAYTRMLREADRNPELRQGLARLADLDSRFRVYFLGAQSGEELMEELARDLERDARLAQFTRKQRGVILKNWIEEGDHEAAGEFLQKNESSFNRAWWFWSLLKKEQAEFEEAVNYIRAAITSPTLPEAAEAKVPIERLRREFSVVPGDLIKGTALLRRYIDEGDFEKAREVCQTMIAAQKEVPLYVLYWRAESYYQLQDYIESWYAYEEYLKQLWKDQ
ncbi:MAG TPA: O-antigen ligase family protein [Opitutales bacterium]|nr:O-antigen ligase family protein [Opitutales bacterium]